MTHREEIEWARRRFEEFLMADGPLLLREDDPRVQQLKRIIVRIVTALEEPDSKSRIVTAADRYMSGEPHVMTPHETNLRLHTQYPPSARAMCDASMPFFS